MLLPRRGRAPLGRLSWTRRTLPGPLPRCCPALARPLPGNRRILIRRRPRSRRTRAGQLPGNLWTLARPLPRNRRTLTGALPGSSWALVRPLPGNRRTRARPLPRNCRTRARPLPRNCRTCARPLPGKCRTVAGAMPGSDRALWGFLLGGRGRMLNLLLSRGAGRALVGPLGRLLRRTVGGRPWRRARARGRLPCLAWVRRLLAVRSAAGRPAGPGERAGRRGLPRAGLRRRATRARPRAGLASWSSGPDDLVGTGLRVLVARRGGRGVFGRRTGRGPRLIPLARSRRGPRLALSTRSGRGPRLIPSTRSRRGPRIVAVASPPGRARRGRGFVRGRAATAGLGVPATRYQPDHRSRQCLLVRLFGVRGPAGALLGRLGAVLALRPGVRRGTRERGMPTGLGRGISGKRRGRRCQFIGLIGSRCRYVGTLG
jgi:hypothetical protein